MLHLLDFCPMPPPLLLDDESFEDCDLNLRCLLLPSTTPQITLTKISTFKVTLLFEFSNIFPKPIYMILEAW
jgi:hypothetical protein